MEAATEIRASKYVASAPGNSDPGHSHGAPALNTHSHGDEGDDTWALADGIEAALRDGWKEEENVDERLAFASKSSVSQAWSELLSSLVS